MTQGSAHSAISLQPGSQCSPSSEVVSKWLVVFAEVFARELTAELVAIWRAALGHLEADVLNFAFERALRSCRFFPTPADVLVHFEKVEAIGIELGAEDAFGWALNFAQLYVIPDMPTGIAPDAPEIPAATDDAVRVAGGWRRLESCPEEGLVWFKKRFVEQYERLHDAERFGRFASNEQARELLGKAAALLKDAPARGRLPAASGSGSAPAAGEDTLSPAGTAAMLRSARERFGAKDKPDGQLVELAPTEQEFEARKARMKRALVERVGQAQKP